jgi:hypothetical protein
MSYKASELVFGYAVLLNLFTAVLVGGYCVDIRICKSQVVGSEVERKKKHTHTHTAY